MRAWLVKLLGGADPDDARIAYESAEYWHNSYREQAKANTQLRADNAKLVRNFQLLRDQFNAANPAPNDTEWCRRFTEADKELKLTADLNHKLEYENATLKRKLEAWNELMERIRG